jgi:hypothetical protein
VLLHLRVTTNNIHELRLVGPSGPSNGVGRGEWVVEGGVEWVELSQAERLKTSPHRLSLVNLLARTQEWSLPTQRASSAEDVSSIGSQNHLVDNEQLDQQQPRRREAVARVELW